MSINPTVIMMISLILIALPVVMFLYSKIYLPRKDASTQDVDLENEVMVTAEVIAVLKAKNWKSDNPVYKMTFRFKTPQGEMIESPLIKTIPFNETEKYKVGKQLTIKYISGNPRQIAIFDKPLVLYK